MLTHMAKFSSFISSQYDMQRQSLVTMAQEVSALNLKFSLQPVSTFSNGHADIHDHITALQHEISRMACTMSNPICRSTFEIGMKKALQETLSRLGYSSCDREKELTDLHILQRQNKENGSTVSYSSSKQPSWTIRNVKRNDFVLNILLGTIYVRSKTNVLESSLSVDRLSDGNDMIYERITSLCVCPATWLVKLGIVYGLKVNFHNSAIWGWKQTIHTFRQVPDDAMIFEFCKEGNLSGVQTLLSRGRASVRDTDSLGRTALYVSRPKDFNFLIIHQPDI